MTFTGPMPAMLCAAFVVIIILRLAPYAYADINPWIRSNLYNPGKWDTAGPGTATPWLHPPTWAPGQGWGVLGGNSQAQNVTGGWGGFRDDLVRDGLSFQLAYLGQFAANPIGGFQSGGESWRGDLAGGVFADLQRLFGWQRTYFVSTFSYQDGTASLTPDNVGNQFPVQLSSSDEDRALRLVLLAAGTQLFDNTAQITVGRLAAGDDFAALGQACNSLNQAICGNPVAAAQNISFSTYPDATWGARAEYKPGKDWYARAGAYLATPEIFDEDSFGVDFGVPGGSGALVLGELGYVADAAPDDSGASGTYKIGGYYDGETLTDLSSGTEERGTWGVYAMAEQHVYREDDTSNNGLWAWLALSYAPPYLNRIEFMAAGGLSYDGPFEGRPDDTVSVIFARGQFSDDLPGQDAETLIEVNYHFQVSPWLYLQPDFQYVIDPDGRSDIEDAAVFGVALGMQF